MLRYILTRLLWIPVVLIGLSLITFAVSRMVPGDPVKLAAGPQARPEQIQKLAAEFGMDRPLPEQYLRYMAGLAQGNWGYSISNRRPVLPDLMTYFMATLELTIVATTMGLLFGIPLAVVAARWRDLWPDHVSRVVAIGAVSIPIFWIAIILQVVFGQILHWFPVSGRFDPRQPYPETYTGMLLIDTLLAGDIQAFFTAAALYVLAGIVPVAGRDRPGHAPAARRFARHAAQGFCDGGTRQRHQGTYHLVALPDEERHDRHRCDAGFCDRL